MNVTVLLLLLYFTAMIGIGVWAMKRSSQDSEGYLLGGRSIGPAVTALRLQSSSMSGYMFLGAGSLGYTQGYFGMWYALGDLGGGIINLSVLGRRMRKLSQMLGSITSIEYLENRYPSVLTRLVAAPVALLCLFFYVLAQFIAGGRGLEMVTGVPYAWSLLTAVGIIVGYTFLGGYLAVAYTDFVQAIVMVVGMVWIVIATLFAVGGLTAGHEKIGALDSSLLTMWGKDLQYQGQWGLILGALLIFSIGYMGWPHVVVSHMAMSRPSIARRAGAYSVVFNLLFVPGAYFVGIMALLIVPNLDDPELAIFAVAEEVLPAFAVGLVMAAIMAAIMSTADALLLQAGTIASYDLFVRFFRPGMDDKGAVRVSRVTVLLLAIVGFGVAVFQPPAVFTIVVFATTVLGSAFVPSYVAAVWWKKANAVGAVASMITGTVTSVLWELTGAAETFSVHAMVVGVVSSTVAMVVGSLLTQRSHPVPERVERAVAEVALVRGIPRALMRGEDASLAAQIPGDRS